MVCPTFVDKNSQLAGVNDVYNAILVRGEATGDVVFYGKGAGKYPTASAVVNDVVNALIKCGSSNENPSVSLSLSWDEDEQVLSPPTVSEKHGGVWVFEGL